MASTFEYEGYQFDSFSDACMRMYLDYKDVLAWLEMQGLEPNAENLREYIAAHRYKTDGIIFTNMLGVSLHHGVTLVDLERYMRRGYSLELAAHMIRRGLPADYFVVRKTKNENTK